MPIWIFGKILEIIERSFEAPCVEGGQPEEHMRRRAATLKQVIVSFNLQYNGQVAKIFMIAGLGI